MVIPNDATLCRLRRIVIDKNHTRTKRTHSLTRSMYENVFGYTDDGSSERIVSMRWGDFIEGALAHLPHCTWLSKKYRKNIRQCSFDFVHKDPTTGKFTFFEVKSRDNTLNSSSKSATFEKIKHMRARGHDAYVIYYDSRPMKGDVELSGRQFFEKFFGSAKLFDDMNRAIMELKKTP